MKKKTGKTKTLYSSEFKERAIKLAKELGSTRQGGRQAWNRAFFDPFPVDPTSQKKRP